MRGLVGSMIYLLLTCMHGWSWGKIIRDVMYHRGGGMERDIQFQNICCKLKRHVQ